MSLLATTMVDYAVWVVAASICVLGAMGVVFLRNTVHNALSLVATLFGVAVLFVAQEAYFLAAVQVIVYAGAIVVLFLFVIMLLGVDRTEAMEEEPNAWRRPLAVAASVGGPILVLVAALVATEQVTGERSVVGRLDPDNDVMTLGRALFTRYVYAFEITAVLLTIAVVGAVVLVRRQRGAALDAHELPEVEDADVAEEVQR